MKNVNLASIEYLRAKNVHFCIHAPTGHVHSGTLTSFMNWSNTAHLVGVAHSLDISTDEPSAPISRNALIAKFLAKPEATHIMFVDPDVTFQAHEILLLLSAGKEMIGGAIPKLELPIDHGIRRTSEMAQEGSILEVISANPGFLLIERSAFNRLDTHESVMPYRSASPELDPYTKSYFNNGFVDGEILTDGDMFAEKWKAVGGKIWMQTELHLARTGPHVYAQA